MIIISSQYGCFLCRHNCSPIPSYECFKKHAILHAGNLVNGKAYMENTPFAVLPVLGPDNTIMHLNDSLTNGQAESKAIYFPCETCVYTMKTIKDTFEMFDRYTHTIIAHENFQHLSRNTHWLLIIFCASGWSRLDLRHRMKHYLDHPNTR